MIAVPYIWWFTLPHEQAAAGCADDLAGEGLESMCFYMGEGERLLEAGSDPLLHLAARDPGRFDALANQHGALAHGGKWFDVASDAFVFDEDRA